MILITRPKPEAIRLKNKIENLGYAAHIDSLSKIIIPKFRNSRKSKQIILISSQRAAKIFIEGNIKHLDLPILVIGNISYQKLQLFGFKNILYKAKDSTQLYKYLIKNLLYFQKNYGSKITYMTGSVLNKKFINKLEESGYVVEKKIIYRTLFKSSLHNSTVELLKSNQISACLIYSHRNAEQFCKLILKKNLFSKCKNLPILTLSKNISHVMKKNGYSNVFHAMRPTQISLINKLRKVIML